MIRFKKTVMTLYEPMYVGKQELTKFYTSPPAVYYLKDVVMEFKKGGKKYSTYILKPVIKKYYLIFAQEVNNIVYATYMRDEKEVEEELRKQGIIKQYGGRQ